MVLKRIFSVGQHFDWLLLSAVILLLCFGLAALYSITVSAENPDFVNFSKQIIFALIGFGFLVSFTLIDYRLWRDWAALLYIGSILLLVAVLFFGQLINGTRGWFALPGFNFQPVEVAKIAVIIALANFFSQTTVDRARFKTFIQSGLIVALPCVLVLAQPDFGSAVVLFGIWFLVSILAGVPKKYLAGLIGLLAIGFAIAWFSLFQPFQKDRIITFLNPQFDPYGRGYHVRQAIIAVGAGGFLGRGLGFGSQSQLKFIPASQTDFIFAVIGEELGFVGVGLVLLFWGLIFYRLTVAALRTKDQFAAQVMMGVSALFFIQMVVNVGMNVGLLPVTGISLPFVSYGGSFLVVSLALVGLAENIIIRSRA